MGDALKRSEFIEDSVYDGLELMKTQLIAVKEQGKETAKSLKKDLSGAFKGGKADGDALAKIASETKKLTTETQELSKVEKDLIKLEQKLNEARSDSIQKNVELKLTIADQNKINKQSAIIDREKEGSIKQLGAQLSLNKTKYQELSKAQREDIKVGGALLDLIEKQKEEYKGLQKSIGNTQVEVGNYKNEVKDALKESGFFDQQINALTDIQTKFNAILKTTGVTAKGTSKGFKILRAALISTGIGIIVVALGSLVAFLTQTKKGTETLSKAMAFLKGGFQVVAGLAAKLGESIFNAFSNPKEALIDFADTLKEFVIRRVDEFVSGIKGLGSAISLLFKGEFKEAMKVAGDASLDLLTATNPLAGVIKDNSDAISDLVEEINKEANASLNLEKRIIALKDATRGVRLEIVKLSAAEENNRSIADDATRSFKEREEAAEKARIASEQRALKETSLAKQELSIINERVRAARNAGLISNELLDEQLAANELLIQSEKDYTLTLRENEQQRNELKQDRLERDLDFLLDIFDNQKTINEQIIADENRTFAERKRLLLETQGLGEKTFSEQIEVIQQFTKDNIDANDLLAESDAKRVQEKVRALGLSEIIEGRLLEVIRDRKSAIQDLSVAERELDQERLDKQQEAVDAFIKSEQDKNVKLLAIEKEFQDAKRDLSAQGAEAIAMIAGEALINNQISAKEAGKQALFAALDVLEKRILILIAESTAKGIAQGPLGVIKAAVKVGAIKGIFAGIKSKISAYAKGTEDAPGGMAIVGEEGQELTYIPKHTKVVTARETRGLLNSYGDEIEAMRAGTYEKMQQAKEDFIKNRERQSVAANMSNMITMMRASDPKLLKAVRENRDVNLKNVDYLVDRLAATINADNSFKQFIS